MLDLNLTLFFQLANFFIALYLLNILLIRPIRDVLKKRQAIVDGLTNEAEDFETKAQKSLADYDAALQKARQDAGLARQQGREAGLAEQHTLVSSAQQEARTILNNARDTMQKEAAATLEKLRADTGKLSQLLAQRILGN
ncbi:MAG: ATP synthase F0 subunit B [Desulfovibrionaceae bacterium]|nr:ATP synthase F0 subunit B [Desulfovibrionaceae bacterium]